MALVWKLFKNAWFNPPKPVTESFGGRTIIVTGATSGIGHEAVIKFVALGASKVIIAARDVNKGEATKRSIEDRTAKKGVLEVWELDMASYDSVVAFAERAKSLDRLDIAVLNAGVQRAQYTQLEHGWEETLQVHTLSTTLLAILLLPKLKQMRQLAGQIPVLEFTTSGLHQSAIISPEIQKEPNILEYYNRQENFGPGNQYKITKVFLMYATNKLATEVSSGEVIITSVCPGVVKTDLGRDYSGLAARFALTIFYAIFGRNPNQGANSLISGTLQGEKAHGRFWQHDRIQPLAPSIAGEEKRALGLRIWDEIIEALKKDVPAVAEALDLILQHR